MLAILFVVMVTAIVLYRRKKTPLQRKLFLFKFALSVVLFSLVYLTFTGKMHFLVAIGAAVLPFIIRLAPFIKYIPVLRKYYQQKKSSQKTNDGETSSIETSLLTMIINHDTGQMEGIIRVGRFADKKLTECSEEQLFRLYQQAENNHQDSLSVLNAYLDRVIGGQWRQRFESEKADKVKQTDTNEMSTSEALDILGINSDASREEIIKAHRKLIQKLHPDRGGSHYLAAKLNQAKALLLK